MAGQSSIQESADRTKGLQALSVSPRSYSAPPCPVRVGKTLPPDVSDWGSVGGAGAIAPGPEEYLRTVGGDQMGHGPVGPVQEARPWASFASAGTKTFSLLLPTPLFESLQSLFSTIWGR